MKKLCTFKLKRLACALLLLSAPSMQAQILFDNGPISNSTGTGAGGADQSVLYTTTFGMGTIGFGHQATAFNRVADDFTSTDCMWRIDSIVFFGYQTGSTTTSTFTGVNFRIWDSIPDAVGSNIVFGDTTTNRMTRTAWSNTYRVTETTSGNSTRPIMRNVCAVSGLILPAGTYWLDWSSTGSLASGPWANPRTPVNVAVTGNGRQRVGSVWNNALDGGTGTPAQGFPFIIYGTVLDATADAGLDLSVCAGASVTIGGSPAGTGSGPLSYSWSPSGSLNNAATSNPLATPSSTTPYVLTVTDSLGCVAMDTTNITVTPASTSTITPTACVSYTAPSGNVLTTSGTFNDVIPNAAGCDSLITIMLTINQPTSATLNPVACYSYLSPAGNTYTSSGTYNETLTNAMGCDSSITINLTINGTTTSTISPSACDSYTAPSGAVYTTSGTYMDTIPNMTGCDSVITIQLLIDTVNVGVTMTGVVLTADAAGATYQWVYCDSAYAAIPGETGQSFFPTADGNYAVIVTENSCTDTSACTMVIGTGVKSETNGVISVYPNPAYDNVTVDCGTICAEVMITIMDMNGRLIAERVENNVQFISVNTNIAQGTYFMTIVADGRSEVKRLIIQ